MSKKIQVDFDVTEFHQQNGQPQDDEIHQCELLKYLNRYLQYVRMPHSSRWRLIVPEDSTGDNDMVVLSYVLFCPCCGKDLRKDTGEGIPGRPHLESLLAEVKGKENETT